MTILTLPSERIILTVLLALVAWGFGFWFVF
jgi:hypothetical protein